MLLAGLLDAGTITGRAADAVWIELLGDVFVGEEEGEGKSIL